MMNGTANRLMHRKALAHPGSGLPLKWLVASLLPLLASTEDFAQRPQEEGTSLLPSVVVTAPAGSLVSPNAQAASQLLRGYPGATGLVTPEDFGLGRGSYLEDFLRFEPGIFVQSAQGSEDTKVSIRGSGIQSDGIAGLELLIDGMPLNQADGEAYLHDLDLRSIKYAEVFRGADALRYGAVTLGGAINLVTYTGRDAGPFSARFSAGSFGFLEQAVSSGWSRGPVDAYLSVLDHTLDGYRAWSQENYQKVFGSLGYQIGRTAENRLYFFFGRLDQNNPSSLSKEEMEANPRQTEPEAVQQKWHTAWTYERLVDRFVATGDEWSLQLGAYWSHRQQTQRQEYEEDYRLGTDRYRSDDFGGDIAFVSTADWFGGKNRFTIGFIPSFEQEPDSWYANLGGRTGPLIAADRTFSANLPFYVDNQHHVSDSLALLTGFQAVYVKRVFHDTFRSATLGDQSHQEGYAAFNPKLGVGYEWAKNCLAYLNVSRSFQPPSFDESLRVQEGTGGGEVFNPLRAQTAITLELGTRGEAGPFSWDLAIYRSWVRNELLDLNNRSGEPLGTVNAPRTIHQGIEAGLEAELVHALLARGRETGAYRDRLVLVQSYSLNDFSFRHNPVYGDNRVAGIPTHFYKAELRYEHPAGFYAGINVEANLVKYPVDEANSLFADPYALLGLRLGYKSSERLELFFEARNLTNKVYAATVEPLADARMVDPDSFNPGNGRAFYGGVAWTW
jgi:iron complex outermembrane receptor protein